MSSGSHFTHARVRPRWLVVTLAALLTVPLVALPASAAPPVTGFTDVTITGQLSGTDCVWRMEATIENFRGGGKNFFASLGGPNGVSQVVERRYVKGKVTSFVWETTLPLTHFPSVDTWAVSADNNKGRQATLSSRAAGIMCGAQDG